MLLKTFRCLNLSQEIPIFELSQMVYILAKTKQTWLLDVVNSNCNALLQSTSCCAATLEMFILFEMNLVVVYTIYKDFPVLKHHHNKTKSKGWKSKPQRKLGGGRRCRRVVRLFEQVQKRYKKLLKETKKGPKKQKKVETSCRNQTISHQKSELGRRTLLSLFPLFFLGFSVSFFKKHNGNLIFYYIQNQHKLL